MFTYTLDVLAAMQREAPGLYQAGDQQGAAPAGRTGGEWKRMAEKMRILKDEATGIYEQHDGYFDLPHVDVEKIPMSQVPIYKHWAYIRIFRHNMLKAARFPQLALFLQPGLYHGGKTSEL